MRTHHQRWILPGVLAILLCIGDVSLAVRAQDAQVTPDSQTQDSQPADDQDPPGRVARLNYIDGSVTFQPGGENDWVDAALNRPLTGGDNLWADQDSRAELHIGSRTKTA